MNFIGLTTGKNISDHRKFITEETSRLNTQIQIGWAIVILLRNIRTGAAIEADLPPVDFKMDEDIKIELIYK